MKVFLGMLVGHSKDVEQEMRNRGCFGKNGVRRSMWIKDENFKPFFYFIAFLTRNFYLLFNVTKMWTDNISKEYT
jgi:hypothetical protein